MLLTARCCLVSFWFSCQQMMVGKAPSITHWAALFAHPVEKTKIWLDCCMYCWSMADCCLLSTLEGRGWVEGMLLMGGVPSPIPPPSGTGPPRNASKNIEKLVMKYFISI